ncbi:MULTISPECIES: beta-galactosidase [unclassified Halomonas]|uniref:beta-galactosidase n=1 Tax=unclassified Halomonas TaxID=2609666 RepID=UPI00209E7711|nr:MULTISPECIES: beta-galactosidase [unclassified Halomonas]MCP1314295.1 beta-galactosidase [Halomonas sp. 707D7]MCP1326340.1 beta-galactosidase [Halomonas sp. 707D4]
MKRVILPAFCLSSATFAQTPTLISPMIDGMRGCESAVADTSIVDGGEAWQACMQRNESAASLIEASLSRIGPMVSEDGRFELGYTLGMPLLSYVSIDDGEINVDRDIIRHDLGVIEDSERSLVFYLFGNHFVLDDQAAAAAASAADPRSLMALANGSSPIDNYFSSSIYPWSLGDDEALYQRARTEAMNAVLDEVCRLPQEDRDKIRAVTTLGETHHFFTDFMGGMGYERPFEVTDYSEPSQTRFRQWLETRFDSISRLNAALSSSFESFEQINAPSKDIASQPLNNYFEHFDAHAYGELPFFGWAFDANGEPFDIYVYLDGQFIGEADTDLTRLDVAQAIDGLEDSNVGYRYDLDFKTMSPGLHSVELRIVTQDSTSLLERYTLAVIDRQQSTPEPVASYQLPEPAAALPGSLRFWADYPPRETTVYYNPLAALWNEFREHQVQHEIETYADIISQSCFEPEQVFSHQIAPEFKGSWNPQLFAASASLNANEHYSQGINLYGGIIYADYFFDWLDKKGHERYGVPEMHPMTNMDPDLLAQALTRHHDNGAVFLSPYFVSILDGRFGTDEEHGKFMVREDNADYGSAQYFQALRQVMNAPAP